jgi:hypothetical protein
LYLYRRATSCESWQLAELLQGAASCAVVEALGVLVLVLVLGVLVLGFKLQEKEKGNYKLQIKAGSRQLNPIAESISISIAVSRATAAVSQCLS